MNNVLVTFKYDEDCSLSTHSIVENVYEELNNLPVFTSLDQIPEELLDFIAQVSSLNLRNHFGTTSTFKLFIKFQGKKSNFINPVENQTFYKTFLQFLKRSETIQEFFKQTPIYYYDFNLTSIILQYCGLVK